MIKQLFSTEAVLVSNFPPQITRTPMSGVLSLSQAILLLLKKNHQQITDAGQFLFAVILLTQT